MLQHHQLIKEQCLELKLTMVVVAVVVVMVVVVVVLVVVVVVVELLLLVVELLLLVIRVLRRLQTLALMRLCVERVVVVDML